MTKLEDLKRIAVAARAHINSTLVFLKGIAPLNHPDFMLDKDKVTLGMYKDLLNEIEKRFQDCYGTFDEEEYKEYGVHTPFPETLEQMIRDSATLRPITPDASPTTLIREVENIYYCSKETIDAMKHNRDTNSTYNQEKYEKTISVCYKLLEDAGELGDVYRELLDAHKDRLDGKRTVMQDVDFYKRLQGALIMLCLNDIHASRKYNGDNYNAIELNNASNAVNTFANIMNILIDYIPHDEFVANDLKSPGFFINYMNNDTNKFLEEYGQDNKEATI